MRVALARRATALGLFELRAVCEGWRDWLAVSGLRREHLILMCMDAEGGRPCIGCDPDFPLVAVHWLLNVNEKGSRPCS